MYENTEPFFVVDIRGEYRHIPAFYTLKAFVQFLQEDGFTKTTAEGRKKQFRFNFSTSKEYEVLFRLLANFKNCTIIIDEADALFTVSKYEKGLIDLFLGSRNNNVHLVFIGKRPFLIPIVVRSQADEWYIFAIEEKRDVQYLSERLRKEFPKNPYDLKRGECIIAVTGEKPVLKQFEQYKGDKL